MFDEIDALKRRYADFALLEAKGRSEPYFRLAEAIAHDPASLQLLLELPAHKRQPNLVFACVRRFGIPQTGGQFRHLFERHRSQIEADILAKRTQTNEPARCSALYLALSTLSGPISLIELGSSAGLCLIPDLYRYRFNDVPFDPVDAAPDAPVFHCALAGPTPTLRRSLEIRWRRGIDLNPIDPNDEAQTDWLETLVWPGQEERVRQLRAAIAVARRERPIVEQGDLSSNLARLVAAAPAASTVVVYHSAVMNYLDRPAVREFEREMASTNAIWVSVEDPRLFPGWMEGRELTVPMGRFLVAVQGEPLGHVHPHGGDIVWFG